MKNRTLLAISGLDPTGGAGMAMDIRVATAYGFLCAPIVTGLAIQTNDEGISLEATNSKNFSLMLDCALSTKPLAVKIGMLANSPNAEIVSDKLSGISGLQVVLDTVLASSSGMPLIDVSGIEIMKKRLIPIAAVFTPNWPEASVLSGRTIESLSDAIDCAKALFDEFNSPVLLTGGHCPGKPVDILVDSDGVVELPSEKIPGSFRGTGCALSMMITAELAEGRSLRRAVLSARECLAASMANSTQPYITITC